MSDITQSILPLKIICSIGLLFFGLVLMAASYPLTKGSIGMNRWYGIRFPQAFYSDKSWYEINAYGGRVFMKWAVFVVIAGMVFVFIPLDNLLLLFSLYMSVFGSIIIPIIITYAYAAKFKIESTA